MGEKTIKLLADIVFIPESTKNGYKSFRRFWGSREKYEKTIIKK